MNDPLTLITATDVLIEVFVHEWIPSWSTYIHALGPAPPFAPLPPFFPTPPQPPPTPPYDPGYVRCSSCTHIMSKTVNGMQQNFGAIVDVDPVLVPQILPCTFLETCPTGCIEPMPFATCFTTFNLSNVISSLMCADSEYNECV